MEPNRNMNLLSIYKFWVLSHAYIMRTDFGLSFTLGIYLLLMIKNFVKDLWRKVAMSMVLSKNIPIQA